MTQQTISMVKTFYETWVSGQQSWAVVEVVLRERTKCVFLISVLNPSSEKNTTDKHFCS